MSELHPSYLLASPVERRLLPNTQRQARFFQSTLLSSPKARLGVALRRAVAPRALTLDSPSSSILLWEDVSCEGWLSDLLLLTSLETEGCLLRRRSLRKKEVLKAYRQACTIRGRGFGSPARGRYEASPARREKRSTCRFSPWVGSCREEKGHDEGGDMCSYKLTPGVQGSR